MVKVWLITGCSSGFGAEIATAALAQGDTVVATARDPTKLTDLAAKGAITVALDVVWDDAKLAATIKDIIAKTSSIDILINNAGYILTGAVEECSQTEVEATFNTNVFGQLNVMRAVLPYMRAARSGIVANLGSIGGWSGTPGAGLYCATKACAAIYSEALRAEVAHLGIQVVCIEPGYFRTNFLSQGHRTRAAKVIDELSHGVASTHNALDAYDRQQPGDPKKGAKAIVDILSGGEELPKRLLLGSDAYKIVGDVLTGMQDSMAFWKEAASQTDHAP